MINENTFNDIKARAFSMKYSSILYLKYDDVKNAEIIRDDDKLILFLDRSKTPVMVYFATNDFASVAKVLGKMTGPLRINFVPQEHVMPLVNMGFEVYGEFFDYFNRDLPVTADKLGNIAEATWLDPSRCGEASDISQKCRLQSRGFEGGTGQWFEEWLAEGNGVIIAQKDSAIVGVCCVSFYDSDSGKTLWIRMMAVDPKHQGAGFGKLMLEQAIGHGVTKGATIGFLATDRLNKNAIRLYEKYGFVRNTDDSEIQMIKQ